MFGIIDDTQEPWVTMPVQKRLNVISKAMADANATYDPGKESFRQTVRKIYTMIRETWERIIEEVLFADVVGRFRLEVRTLLLRAAWVDADDQKAVFNGMKRCSTYSGHDAPREAPPALPRFDEIDADFAELTRYYRLVDDRRKRLEKEGSVRQRKPRVAELLT